ncbi:MAG: pyruvate formate lyase-activating protein [Eubacterium sp.]|nr:pyruvate formate lyase-activating protein [Eubacterium sp.]
MKSYDSGVTGYIHSVETFGAVDGPGIRYIVFVQGCPLRCVYCHNPDSWKMGEGKKTDSKTVADDIKDYLSFICRGGVTVSGGEPLLQPEFVADILRRCKEMGLHTALDTSGYADYSDALKVLKYTDLVLLDIKAYDAELYTKVTGADTDKAKLLLSLCETLAIKVWVRHVIVPQYTADIGQISRLADYLSAFSCIEKVEPIAFHKMGEYKWEKSERQYQLSDIQPPDSETMEKIKEIFSSRGLQL